MKLRPIEERPRPRYPRWGTSAARSLRRGAAAAASSLLMATLGCGEPRLAAAGPEAALETSHRSPTAAPRQPPSPAPPAAPGRPAVAPASTEEWVRIPVRITFDSGSGLDDTDKALLQEVLASVAHRTDVLRIRVEGFAPDWENAPSLSLERAQNVVDYLVNDAGLSRELFEIRDGGSSYSLAGAVDRVMWQRVELQILVRRAAE